MAIVDLPARAGARADNPRVVELTPACIELPSYDYGAALALERALGVSHVVAQILVRRGHEDPGSARAFMQAAEHHDPSEFNAIDRAVATIERHIRAGGRIVVHGDYDVDGVCATAVLVRALRSLGADTGFYLPSRSEDGYGLSLATVERLSTNGTTLLVTVDCGITAVEQVAAAVAAGLDVVVTDHHSPRSDGALPDCPILHPVIGGYPTAELCGTAVAHKLAQALGAPTAEADLELVALATVADLMPLVGENRRLVREGLAQMAGTDRPGMRALMAVSRTDPSGLDASCLGFRLAPRINAAGRMRRADAGLELLMTDDAERAAVIARELDAVNTERRAVEQRISWEAESIAEQMGERSAYVIAAPGWHPGVIGIVASRIVERFHRPAIMIALDSADPASPGQGSGRSIAGFDLLGALEATGEHLVTFGGHRAAAGLSVLPENLDDFRDAFEAHAQSRLTPDLLTPSHRVDAVASGADLSLTLAEELLSLAPFGNGNPDVRLYVAGATFDDVRTMGDSGQHARFNVNAGGVRASAVAFGSRSRFAGVDGAPVDASFKLERNVWNGVVEPRLVLLHGAPCSLGEIQFLGEPEDYMSAMLDELCRPEAEDQPAQIERRGQTRTVIDRRGESVLAVLSDARAAADDMGVLAVCADIPRRLAGLRERTGGFALISHHALADEPELADGFSHVVVLDPPTSAAADANVRAGGGFTHFVWGEAELRFAQQMHEQEYELRASLVALYRSLRDRGRVAGGELEHLLRGDGSHARSARLAGRLLRVLTELGLVSLDLDLPALELADAQPTQLERSPAFRVYTKTNEDGQRFLSATKPRPLN